VIHQVSRQRLSCRSRLAAKGSTMDQKSLRHALRLSCARLAALFFALAALAAGGRTSWGIATGAPFDDPAAIDAATGGDIFLGDLGGSDNLFLVSADGSTITDVEAIIGGNPLSGISGVVIAAENGDGQATTLLVAEFSSNEVSRVDLTYTGSTLTGASAASISTGTGDPVNQPLAIALGLDGSAFFSGANNNGFYRITDPLGTPSTTFLDFSTVSGGVDFTNFQPNVQGVFQFTPVPEPSTRPCWLFGVALMARRRR